MYLTELASTTRLFLVAVVCAGCFRNGLTIWNLWLIKDDLNLLVVLHAPFESAEMEFTLSVNKNLAEFLALFDLPCRVFLTHLLKGVHHLLGLAFVDSADGTRILGVGIFNEVEAVVAILAVKCITGLDIFELNAAANVAGDEFIYFNTVRSSTSKHLSYAFLAAAVCVG